MSDVKVTTAQETRGLRKIEIVGLTLVVLSLVGLLFNPSFISGLFDAMLKRAHPIIVNAFITGTVGVAIIISVMVGRILERCGFTDALMRIFIPIAKAIGVNPAVVIPAVYNILGDINAAGRIAGPILVKAGATKDEQKIAVVTMMQSQQSFSTFMFGILALTAVGVNPFVIIAVSLFIPLVMVPWLLRMTIYRDTKAVSLDELPSFTPNTPALPTIFNAAREGAELLFLLIIPAIGVIFSIIGALDYLGVWKPFEAGLTAVLNILSIDPKSGMVSILASPTLAMAQLKDVAANMNPKLVVGSVVLAWSGYPFSVIFGQLPAIWSGCTDLNHKEAMYAAILGAVLKLLTAGLIAIFLTPLLV
ncbi:hypothetical protein BR63_12035 [Thermanaerosceptrum fracticalcis]|uniref:Nucleoside transporter/FeoB GTPase Gate domain-containing protein n=1 Tax=Thermanaerosceptrum fracticalcis TaxID=1712410 RepID=A0A7G6E4G5_THEFR|nr:hypothetical protein [Thermanaerosceptrum fracticalcis]QNB46969.1 hypothetical protein BR63_12035 [Thermanaerosceptrum fracticalcis]